MRRKHWLDLAPSFLVAAGIVVATLVTVRAAQSGWLILAGPLLLALAIVGADVLASKLKGKTLGPSWTALFLGGACLLAGFITTLRDPNLVKTLIPALGIASWVTLLLRPDARRKT